MDKPIHVPHTTFPMNRTPLHQQVDTLPELVRQMIDPLVKAIAKTLPKADCVDLERVFTTGCGDSHHASVISELAFEQLAGLPCEPMTAMQFGRYAASFLPDGQNLVLAVSVSGRVSRTAEALEMGRKAGALAIGLTGNPKGALAAVADRVLKTAVPPLSDEKDGLIVPGTRSYIASQLALILCAIHIGQMRDHLTKKRANQLRQGLVQMADLMEQTIAACDGVVRETAVQWQDADSYVFCGSGPNYGAAMFSAAKVVEASGDMALAQDTEEWAHLQYFNRAVATPTFFLSGGEADTSRTAEVVTAAEAIGRRVAVIGAERWGETAVHFPMPQPSHECFSPLLTSLPPTLFAAYRAQLIDEPYFRAFGGGRSEEGGGGISRIRDSERRDGLVEFD